MSTGEYIGKLESLKSGDLGLLRTRAGQGIGHSSQAFDLFAGVWWPLRQKSQTVPRREVAWLVAKLYAYHPMPQSAGHTLARMLARAGHGKEGLPKRFDRLLMQPLGTLEEPMRWALDQLPPDGKLDWIRLTDDLSSWERETTRMKWAEDFVSENKKEE